MKNSIRLSLIAILVLVAMLIIMPSAWKQQIPFESMRNYLLTKNINYGLDLKGGSQLDFKIDMSRVEEKIAAGEDISKQEIVNGVKSTLQRRIDPDGTRELNIYAADYANEKHIFVELTADIDTPENREKLQRHIDLQFKELKTEPDDSETEAAQKASESALGSVQSGSSLEEIAAEYEDSQETTYDVTLQTERKAYQDQLPEDVAEQLWNLESGSTLEQVTKTLTGYMVDQASGQIQPQEGFVIYRAGNKEITDRTKTESGEDFETVAQELSNTDVREIPLSDIPEEMQNTILGNVPPNGISEVKELEDGSFAVFKLLSANEDNPGVRLAQIVTSSKAEADTAHERVSPKETVTQEEQMTYDQLVFQITPEQWKETGLDGQHFKIAKVGTDANGLPVTLIEFDSDGTKKFEELTNRLIGQPMAIFVGGEFISAPTIQEKISGGSAQISFGAANFVQAQKEAITLANNLNAGAIPAPISLDGELKVTASLGSDALDKSIKAGIIGLILLSIWLIFSYRLLGLFAVFSLTIYSTLLLAIITFSPMFVLTLAGVAGIILSVGMAVDANVLIYERVREELAAGKNYSTSLAIGFERAWTSIRDANLTTLIVCLILWLLGTSIIKGFATMLAMGILLSMFTAITISRSLLKTLTGTKVSKKTGLLVGTKE